MTVAFHEVRRIPATACSCDYHPAHSVCTIIPATSERVSALEDALDSPYCSDLQSSPRRNVLSREEMTMSKESLLLSRRRLLRAGIFIAGTVANLGKPTLATAGSNDQPDWRFCNKCEAMFFNGYPSKGSCPAGGAHVAQGYNFVLPHDLEETPTAQRHWRFCNKCEAMFLNGYGNKGRCAAGGIHVAQGYNFVLPHDLEETPTAQRHWRFCNKCEVMFFNGYGNKGRCAAGGAHVAQGYNFVLPHPPYGCSHCNDGSCQCGYGTGADLCANHRGDDPKIGCIQQQ